MTEEETQRVERIEGQIQAIGMALNLFVEVYADPPALRGAIEARSERMQAHLLASRVPDSVRQAAEAFVNQWLVHLPK